jgi:serine/threonine protein phosphatase 1
VAGRVIAIGDMHGCLAALDALLEAIDLRADDTLVTLGDYIDRGPDSRGVIGRLIELADRCHLKPVQGNHDEMLLEILDENRGFEGWLAFGGSATLASYDCCVPEEIPAEHIDFLRNCLPYFETDDHFFVHASYYDNLPLAEQSALSLRWEPLRGHAPGPHYSGKRAIVGHTAQKDGHILDMGYLVCIDTCCYGDGWLTALDVHDGTVWQADQEGNLKADPAG